MRVAFRFGGREHDVTIVKLTIGLPIVGIMLVVIGLGMAAGLL